MIALTETHKEMFHQDGFAIVEGVLEPETIKAARARFPLLFRGEFETGLQPDEWNWREGRDSNTLTRQICNGWKADRTIAAIVLREDIGRACSELRGWPGARINQDNVIWKPPGSKPFIARPGWTITFMASCNNRVHTFNSNVAVRVA